MGQVVGGCDCCGGESARVHKVPLIAGEASPRPQAYTPVQSGRQEPARTPLLIPGDPAKRLDARQAGPPLASPKAAELGGRGTGGTVLGGASSPLPGGQLKDSSGGTGEAELSGLEWAKQTGGGAGTGQDDNWAYSLAQELQSKPNRQREEEISAAKLALELQSKPMRVRQDVSGSKGGKPTNCTASMVVETGGSGGNSEEQDGPGIYRTTHKGVVVRKGCAMDSEKITKLDVGVTFRVIEVAVLDKEQRLRAHIEKPAGWITIMNTETGERWATRAARVAPDGADRIPDGQPACGCLLALLGRRRLAPRVQIKVNELFCRLDADSSGEITKEEAMEFFKSSFGTISANAMFNEVDNDNSDSITADEFMKFWEQVKGSGYSDKDLEDELDVIMDGGAWVDWKDQRRTEALPPVAKKGSQKDLKVPSAPKQLTRQGSKS